MKAPSQQEDFGSKHIRAPTKKKTINGGNFSSVRVVFIRRVNNEHRTASDFLTHTRIPTILKK
jgi:hypothetical protein